MSNRINKNDLEDMVKQLNEMLDCPLEPYSKQEDGTYKPNGNNYHLRWCYGMVGLDQMCDNGSTGSRDITCLGTKREIFDKIHAMLKGIYMAREASKQSQE